MIIIGHNTEENESLYRCPECRRILDSGESCCAPAPTWGDIELMTASEYSKHCRDKQEAGND